MAALVPTLERVAIACSPRDVEDGRFWETVAVNRGLHVTVCTDIDEARAWLAGRGNPAEESR